MIKIGDKIECYRGEAFEITRIFTDDNGAPLYIKKGTANPYLKLSVHSNTYNINGEYRKNYWLDLSSFVQYKGYRQFDNNVVPGPFGVVADVIDDPDLVTGIIHTPAKVNKFVGQYPDNSTTIKQGLYVQFEAQGSVIPANTPACIKISCKEFIGKVSITIHSTTVSLACLSNSDTVPNTSEFISVPLNTSPFVAELTFNATEQTDYLYLWYFIDNVSTDSLMCITNVEYVNDVNFDNDYIGYIITTNGREYYVAANNNYVPYSFIISKQFLNNDTKDWISGIYEYDITLCSGQLMTDWLTRNFIALYSGITPPTANAELAHYICKKDEQLLDGINITEPLVSYNINTVLLKPTKIIVKEA